MCAESGIDLPMLIFECRTYIDGYIPDSLEFLKADPSSSTFFERLLRYLTSNHKPFNANLLIFDD